MSLFLAFCLAIAIGFSTNSQQSDSAAGSPPRRLVHLHLPSGTKIGPNDKVVPGRIKKRVNPVYPPLARQTRISGTVLLHVTITIEGTLQDIEVVSGHPLLLQAALDAVKQWQYEPTTFNGEPVEVDTTIDVIFNLDDKKASVESSGTPNSQTDAQTPAMRVKMDGAAAGALCTSHPQPIYPKEAKDKGAQGTVRLRAILSKDGSIQQLEAIAGDPLLVQGAMDAVRQWKYRPTLLNGKAVEVETTIDVIFSISDQKPGKS